MNIQEIISKKRDKKELNKNEIQYFIDKYTKGEITDYQSAALIMAIYINGMTKQEITNLTISMAESGDILDLSKFGKNVVDKHSTGGVGDKITLILMPIIASLGIPVAKMSGRGLGYTGGTIDKLESIPGYNTKINIDQFIKNVEEIGISLIGQTLNLAPADKKIYALRDSIACTESIPLIASSIMSKKIASGANKIVLDVTCGSGAFMKNKEEAIELSKTMKEIGELANKETICVITDMNEPLGYSIGNTLEIIETVECLKNKVPNDILEIIKTLGAYIIKLSGKNDNIEENKKMIIENIENGKAYRKFVELVEKQGGDISYIEDTQKLEKAKYIMPVISTKQGYVSKLDAEEVGKISVYLGAGRTKKEEEIDKSVGITLVKKICDKVEKGQTLAYIHAQDREKGENAVIELSKIYQIEEKEKEKKSHILEII